MLQPNHSFWFLSPTIISGVPCLAPPPPTPSTGRFWPKPSGFSARSFGGSAGSPCFLRPLLPHLRGGGCLPNAVSSELCCLAPEQAESKHSTLWLKGHLSRGGNPASFPKSINRGGLLSRGAAHCHGNAPSELGSVPNPAPSHLRSCFLGLGGSLRILAVCSTEGEGEGGSYD